MAGSEGSGQTELLSGWSCVVHRPSEDPEPSELPSTVDMAAFSSGLNVEPTQNANNEDSCDSESDSDSDSNNSGSDISGSCSQSDSSDSESSSSSQGSSTRSSSPEFSVTSSQTNGLRLKIATVRKSCTSPVEKNSKTYSDLKYCDKNAQNSQVKSSNLSTSSDSPCSKSSSESSSDSDAPTDKGEASDSKGNEKACNIKKPIVKVRLKQVEKKVERRTTRSTAASSPKNVKTKTRPKRTRKMASLPLSRGSTGSSSDSEDGSESDRTMLASCSLQEIRQEDLAAILPDQQECDAFGGFDCRPDKSSPHTGDGSGSDMELPQQAVNALIQRTTESSSESESRLPLNPNTLFANSLLQQFVAQTQMLNTPSSGPSHNSEQSSSAPLQTATDTSASATENNSKRKRGRPKKGNSHKTSESKSDKTESAKSILNLEYCGNPNVSPDSGIQNSSDHVSSPEPSPTPNPKSKFNQEGDVKRNSVTAETKNSNKTANVLEKGGGENKNNSNKKSGNSKTGTHKLKEQPKLPITSNSFDRVLYGNADRVLYPPRRKVGRPPVTKKGPGRPPKYKSNTPQEVKPPDKHKATQNELKPHSQHHHRQQQIAKYVAEKPDTNKINNKCKKNYNSVCETTVGNSQISNGGIKKELKSKDTNRKSKSALLHEICERVSKRLDINNKYTQKSECKQELSGKSQRNNNNKGVKPSHKKGLNNRVVLGCKNKLDPLKTKYTTLKNCKVMHSKHKDKKHKKCKFKILKPITATLHDPKLNSEIDKLISDFVKLCNISSSKPSKENVPEMFKVIKKTSKKRKASDYSERKKKKQNVSSSFNKETNSNEQRLPLKKRHYHLSTNDSGTATPQADTGSDLKSKPPTSTKDPKNVSSTSINNKVVVEKSKCVNKTINSTSTSEQTEPDNQMKCNLNNNDYIGKSETVDTHIDEAIEACITRYSSPVPEAPKTVKTDSKTTKIETSKSVKQDSPKGISKLETPPTKTLKADNSKTVKVENLEDKVSILSTPLNTTTPKKRHRLEAKNNVQDVNSVNDVIQAQDAESETIEEVVKSPKTRNAVLETAVVSELKTKKGVSPKSPSEVMEKKTPDKKPETVAQIITRKKNRLEDLTLTLAHKVNSSGTGGGNIDHQKRKKDVVKLEETVLRASVIKSPISKKAKPTESEKLDLLTADQPTGIFMPTIDIELHIPASKIQTNHDKAKPDVPDTVTKVEPLDSPVVHGTAKDSIVPKLEGETKKIVEHDGIVKKKIRKRRAINRTGFPTIKKKKKKTLIVEPAAVSEDAQQQQQSEDNEERNVCDRVPQEGEKYLAFLQRTEKLTVPDSILEKLQKSITPIDQLMPKSDDEESMHELGVVKNRRPLSRLSIKRSRSKDVSPAVSVDTTISDKNAKSITSDEKDTHTDLDELSLEARLELLKSSLSIQLKIDEKWTTRNTRSTFKNDKNVLQKRHLRDISPASSIEPYSEKKIREEVSVSGDEAKRIKKAPRWRKKFLIAGLFSDYYKEDDEAVRLKRTEVATKSKITYNPGEHPYGLLPPPYHCGRYLRCRRIPFQLPYDLWWQHTNSQLPGRDIVPSWNYRKIRTNIYNVKTTAGACEPQACNCSSESGCGDDCINRLVLAECPATHKCQNQKIQKHEWAPGIEKFMTTDKGWGVRTKLPIKSSEFILEYVGEVVSDQEFKERMASRYAHDTHHYCLHLDGGLVIDGHRMGGDGRFVNHSCEPNCEMQKWSVNGQFRMALFALRDIEACEELTYDYNFFLFNPAEGQECKCGSMNCRGVIGGKSQRVRQSTSSSNSTNSNNQVGRVGRPRKNQAKRTTSSPKEPPAPPVPPPLAPVPLMKPMSNAQKSYVREHHCFLLRNLNKAKHNRERSVCSVSVSRMHAATPTDHNATTFMNHLNALKQPRNMKTRRLAQAEDDPELQKTAMLANILRDLLNTITTAKDEKDGLLCTTFATLPSKRKVPEYYQRITNPIDLAVVEQNIATGVYRTVENFDSDMNRIFVNAVRFFGRTSEPGIAATRLKKVYCEAKIANLSKLEETVGRKLPSSFINNKKKGEEEDVIRCICGMYRDEGLMIQCERCLVWQHCECVHADVAAASYHCERCVPRDVDYEIAMDEYTEHGHRYYMTLLRGDLQLRQGDTVYVLRDIPIPGTDRKHTYETIGEIKYTDLDIFRIERLWKDCKTEQRFAYGHHYLRPHETFHEPTRKFFPNEVMRVPLYEAVPVELIISHCWVMDINTYCKGRPIGAPEEHIYICEYRVDKSARLFSKISKTKYPICTKSYAFERFDVRLKISRTYTPHDLDPAFVKPRGRKPQENEEVRGLPQLPVHVPVVRTPSEKKTRLNKILLTLLNKMPTKQALDVSYLLEGGRRRKKQTEK